MIIDHIDKSVDRFLKELAKNNNKLYDLLLNELSKHTSRGRLIINKEALAELDSVIRKNIIASGYQDNVNKLFIDLSKLIELNGLWYKNIINDYSSLINKSDVIPMYLEKMSYYLRGGGASYNIVRPLEEIFRENIMLGRGYVEVQNKLISRLNESDNPTIKYAKQVAYDGMMQYNGAINEQVRVAHDLEWFYYVGSEIETTRPICDHIRDNYPKAIHKSELVKILDEFAPDGIPSKELITYETVNNKIITTNKGHGIYKNTTPENFTILRGGYNCRHDVKWTRNPTSGGKKIDRVQTERDLQNLLNIMKA